MPILPVDKLATKRASFCQARKSEAPSSGGVSRSFKEKQTPDMGISCCRPYGFQHLRIDLIHAAFGEFADNCTRHEPTKEDYLLAREFVMTMANIHNDEKSRQKAIFPLFVKYHIPVNEGTKIGNYQVDGDLRESQFVLSILEVKNEVAGTSSTEPYFQAALYYLEATREYVGQYSKYVLPCILVIIAGPYLQFAGAAWTDRPVVELLVPPLACFHHTTSTKALDRIARHLGAFRVAVETLRTYYQQLSTGLSLDARNPINPYPTSYESANGPVDFEYLSLWAEDRMIFYGKTKNDEPICIKFAEVYGKRVHEWLAEKNLAPKLYAARQLAGGCWMVVMEYIGDEYHSLSDHIYDNKLMSSEMNETRALLRDALEKCLLKLHQAGFVHGDLRNTNIMVKKTGLEDGSFKLVDFDWAGEINEVRYPGDLNTHSVMRPTGVENGGKILAEHDIEMIDYIWGDIPRSVTVATT